MKYIIFIIIGIISLISVKVYAQKYIRKGNTFTSVSDNKAKPLKTTFTYNKDTIYVSPIGHCFVIKTSKKTNKQYRKYLGEELSREICDILKIKYIDKVSNKESQ